MPLIGEIRWRIEARLKLKLGRQSINCQQWTELVTEYLEGTMPRGLARAADRHLADCPLCTQYLDQMRRTIALTGSIPADDVPAPVVDALQRAFNDYRSGQA